MVTVWASASEAALAPETAPTALSTPLMQLLQQRWTSESFTVLSAWAKAARAAVTTRVRMDLFIWVWRLKRRFHTQVAPHGARGKVAEPQHPTSNTQP